MALSDAYITVEDLTTHLTSMSGPTGTNIESLERAINAGSRMIDQHCRRRFYADTVATARSYRPEDSRLVWTHDISTTTDLAVSTDTTDNGTFDTDWTSSDWELDPINALSGSGEAWPYTGIRAVSSRTFPCTGRRSRVEVTAKWGWPSGPPANVVEACLIMSARLFRRRQSPEGVVGFGEFGPVRLQRTDPDVAALLMPYCKVGVFR